jgi:hypothetical protein
VRKRYEDVLARPVDGDEHRTLRKRKRLSELAQCPGFRVDGEGADAIVIPRLRKTVAPADVQILPARVHPRFHHIVRHGDRTSRGECSPFDIHVVLRDLPSNGRIQHQSFGRRSGLRLRDGWRQAMDDVEKEQKEKQKCRTQRRADGRSQDATH